MRWGVITFGSYRMDTREFVVELYMFLIIDFPVTRKIS